jgi:hypothetical protein
MRPRVLTGALLGIGLCFSWHALAQDQVWLKDRRYTEGMGIRAGDLELHPGVAGEFGYDSNFFLRSDKEQPIDAYRLRITPSFGLSNVGGERRDAEGGGGEPPKVGFNARVAATYNYPFAAQSKYSDQFSKQRALGVLSDLRLDILPSRPWGGDVFADFARMVQPSTNPDDNLDRLSTRAGAGIRWSPGGGMFDWRFGYQYSLTYFEDAQFQTLNNHENQINTSGRWRFFPKTALLYSASLGFVRYDKAASTMLESNPVRTRVGLNGLLTPTVSLLAMVGWGSSFYQGAANAQQFDSVIGQAEIKWYFSPTPSSNPGAASGTLSAATLGYVRDFTNSYLGDYYGNDRGYLTLSHLFGNQFLLVAGGGVAAHRYPTVWYNGRTQSHPPFTSLYADASLFGEYRMTSSFGINATVRYSSNITGAYLQIPNGAGALTLDYLEWKRVEAFLGVRWFM